MNCWEFLECGFERGGRMAKLFGVCPAYPKRGRTCARVAETSRTESSASSFSSKISGCVQCAFYRSEHYDKAYLSSRHE